MRMRSFSPSVQTSPDINCLRSMDPSFERRLLENGVGESVIKILHSQRIYSKRVFKAMKEKHIRGLLKCEGMPIGSHALLWELWEELTGAPPIHSLSKLQVILPLLHCSSNL